MVHNTLFRKGHIDKILPRLSQACYIITAVKLFLLQKSTSDDLLCLF